MKWRLNENSKIIIPGSETDYWYLFNGRSFEAITPAVNGDNLEFTVSKNKAIISLIRTNFDVLDTTQLYGKIKSERIKENLKISNNINAHRVDGDNLLTDGSFEEWDDANHLTHWVEYVSSENGSVNRDTDIIDGTYSVRLDKDETTTTQVYQDFALSPGIYQLSVYCKTDTSKAQIGIKDMTNALWWNRNTWQSATKWYAYTNTDWEQKIFIFKVNTNITVRILFSSGSILAGSVWFDNARLEKIGVIEHYDARGGLKVVSDGTSVKKYAIDSQSSNQAELDKVWM